jgi:signal transduction histidine kinase
MNAKTNKSEELGNKASYLSKLGHELRTSIHGIRGLTEYLINNLDSVSAEDQKKHLHSILSASKNLTELTKALSVYNAEQTLIEFNFVATDIVAVTKSTIENFRNTYLIESKIKLESDFNIDIFNAKADKFWYEQLLTNLLSNSLNYSENGTILVNISSEKINNTDYIIISVTDEGAGIAEDELLSIFTPFNRGSRTRNNTKGSGLGLSICQEIVHAHGGTIKATNNKDAGSTIYFSLPKNQAMK